MGGTSDFLFKKGTVAAAGFKEIELNKAEARRSDVAELECEGPTTGTLPVLGLGHGNTFKILFTIDFASTTEAPWPRIESHSIRKIKLGPGVGLDADVDYWLTGKDE
jgi:hypothetical protein